MKIEWRSWCRLCAGSENVCTFLRDNEGNIISSDIIERANKYLRLTIPTESEDPQCFPQRICTNCVNYLEQINTYALQCARVQDMFYSLSFETGEDEIHLIKHKFLNDTLDAKENTKQTCEEVDATNNFELKSYETVQSAVDNHSDLTEKVYRITESGRSSRRGRPRKKDRVVPRIKLRAVRPPSHKTVDTDFSIVTENPENEVQPFCFADAKMNRKLLVGAARRKAKVPKSVHQSKDTIKNKETNQYEPEINLQSNGDGECNTTTTINPNDITENVNQPTDNSNNDDSTPKRLKKSELKKLMPSLFNFTCHVCDCVCKNWNALRTHCKENHGKSAQITCDCGNVLFTQTAILEHLARHTRTNLFSCDSCQKTFHRKSLLNSHMISHLPKEEQPYVCCKCARRFHCEALLRNHERTHLPKEERFMFPCSICNKMFTSKSSVSAHQKAVHQGERPFVCEQCGHCFTSKGILQEHLTVHSDETPWSCTNCDKCFKTKYRLKIHMDTHRETPYQCPKCPVQLSTQRTLRMHLVVHRDTKAYKCSICSKAFRRAKDLKNHNNLHTGRRPYTCPFCSRTFANGSNCRSHKLRIHREELKALESMNHSTESSLAASAETKSNDNTKKSAHISTTDNSEENNAIENFTFISLPALYEDEESKTHSLISQTNHTDSPFSSFVQDIEHKSSSEMKQPSSLLRASLTQQFLDSHYSPSLDPEISSTAVPAFPGLPFVHHQPLMFNRSLDLT